jgi:porin
LFKKSTTHTTGNRTLTTNINNKDRPDFYRCSLLVLGTVLALALAPGAEAQTDNTQSIWTRPTMTGNWGGARTDLESFGITPDVQYTGQFADAFAGGEHQGAGVASQLSFGFKADMDKLVGLQGGSLNVTFNLRFGRSVLDDYTDGGLVDKLQAQGMYGSGENLRVSRLEYQQDLFQKVLQLRLGFFPVGDAFGDSELLCDFSNVSFCAHPQILPADSGWTDYPTGKLGGVFKVNLPHHFYITSGIFDADDLNKEYLHQNGLRLTADDSTGMLIPYEIGYVSSLGAAHMVGHYKLGGWYDTSSSPIQGEAAVNGITPEGNGRYGTYLFIDQMVWSFEPQTNRGLILFGQAAIADRRTALFTNSLEAGFIVRGAFASRPTDYLAVGYTRGQVNDSTISLALTKKPHADYANHEAVLEVGYGVNITPWFLLYPNLQYVQNPAAFNLPNNRIPNAYIGEIETRIKF